MDDTRKLSDYNIFPGDVLKFTRFSYRDGTYTYYIKLISGRTVYVALNPNKTIQKIKNKLIKEYNMVTCVCHELYYNNKKIENNKTLNDYGAYGGSALFFKCCCSL